MDKRPSWPRVPPLTKWHESSREALLRTTRVVSGALQMAKTSKTKGERKGDDGRRTPGRGPFVSVPPVAGDARRSAVYRDRAASRRREPGLRGIDRCRLRTGTARKGRHCQRRRLLASQQQSLSAGPAERSPRGRGETSGRGAGAKTGGYAFPQAPRSVCPS